MNYCPQCGGKLTTETSPGGIPRRVCSDCDGGIR
ncbi:zinc ribbon domain-containing protein [Natrinema versiforme]